MIAPILAAKSADVAFIVMMAGTGVKGSDLLQAQASAIMRASGSPDSAIAESTATQEQLFALADPKLSTAQLDARRKEIEQSILAKVPERSAIANAENAPWSDRTHRVSVDALFHQTTIQHPHCER